MADDAIKIPDPNMVKVSFPDQALPATAGADMVNPCAVMVDNVAAPSGGVQVVRATANKRNAFYGYNVMSNVLAQHGAAPNRGCIVTGFTGVVAQVGVWISPNAWPVPDADWSGLTQTDPADGTLPIGVGLAGNRIWIYP